MALGNRTSCDRWEARRGRELGEDIPKSTEGGGISGAQEKRYISLPLQRILSLPGPSSPATPDTSTHPSCCSIQHFCVFPIEQAAQPSPSDRRHFANHMCWRH